MYWEADGNEVSPDFFEDEETRTRIYKDPVSNIVYDRIVYTFNGETAKLNDYVTNGKWVEGVDCNSTAA